MTLLAEFGAIADLQKYVETMPECALEAARISLNDVAQNEGLTQIRESIQEQAAFPPGYLNQDRLGVIKLAHKNDLSVVITGRFRATSLARFARGATISNSRKFGVKVEVKRGKIRTLRGAFLIKLRGARDGFNVGLAIRLKPGESLRNTKGAKVLDAAKGLYLLYGPSVDQIFREVAPTETPGILAKVESEFYRQFYRLLGKKTRGR